MKKARCKNIKQALATFLFAVIALTANAQKQPQVQEVSVRAPDNVKIGGKYHFVLNGKVPQSLNGQKIHLMIYGDYSDNRLEKAYTTLIHNNSFAFTGTMEKPCEMATVNIFNERDLLIGHSNLVLEAKVNQLVALDVNPHDKFFKNKLSHTTIINSKANYIKRLVDSIQLAVEEDKSSAYIKKDRIINEQLKILSKYPDQYYSLLKLYEISGMNFMKNEREALPLKVFDSFSYTLKASALGKEFLTVTTISRNASYLSKAGRQVQEFSVMTDKGQIFSNTSLKGRPYVIAFSATWCVPCQYYQKKLLTLYHKYRSTGLKVVYFNLDNGIITWKEHINKNKLDWINVSERTQVEDSKIAKQFNVNSVPLYIIVDRQGKIAYNADEMDDFNHNCRYLEEYIKKVL